MWWLLNVIVFNVCVQRGKERNEAGEKTSTNLLNSLEVTSAGGLGLATAEEVQQGVPTSRWCLRDQRWRSASQQTPVFGAQGALCRPAPPQGTGRLLWVHALLVVSG